MRRRVYSTVARWRKEKKKKSPNRQICGFGVRKMKKLKSDYFYLLSEQIFTMKFEVSASPRVWVCRRRCEGL